MRIGNRGKCLHQETGQELIITRASLRDVICRNHFNPESLLRSSSLRLCSSNQVFMMFYLKCETLSAGGKRIVPGRGLQAERVPVCVCVEVYFMNRCLVLAVFLGGFGDCLFGLMESSLFCTQGFEPDWLYTGENFGKVLTTLLAVNFATQGKTFACFVNSVKLKMNIWTSRCHFYFLCYPNMLKKRMKPPKSL